MDVEERLKRIEDKLDQIDEKQDHMELELTKYRGMLGGILLAVTAIGAFVKLAWGWLAGHVVWQ
jgi:hypothetical protein